MKRQCRNRKGRRTEMKKNAILSMLLWAGLVLGTIAVNQASAQDPIVMLIQAQGKVLYSTDQKKWKTINRNKFLYEGWGVKTTQNATCKLLHQDSNKMEILAQNTQVAIRSSGTQVIFGSVSQHESSSSLPGQLKRKLAKAQKYTKVDRGDRSANRLELRVADKIRLNSQFPDLAWENAGQEYSYRLIVGDQIYEVPGSDKPVIRFQLPEMAPGKYDYMVQVLYQGEVYHTPDKGGVLVWMSNEQKTTLDEKIRQIQNVDGNNGYLMGNLFDDEKIKVAAMDQYMTFLKKHPDANEVRPFLVKVLHELGLGKMRQKEALLFRENSDKNKE